MYYIFGKYFSGRYEASTLFMYIMPVGALGIIPFISFSEKTVASWACLIFLALFSTFFANSFYYKGLSRLEPTRAVLTATTEPVVAAFFAWLIWNELFTFYGVFGALLVVAAGFDLFLNSVLEVYSIFSFNGKLKMRFVHFPFCETTSNVFVIIIIYDKI